MSNRVGLAHACVVCAALGGMALVSSDARAQQGCCEGGSATGANAWTAGNATAAQWPADPAPPPYAGPIIGKAAPLSAPYWWTHGELEFGLRGFIDDPSRNGALNGNTPAAATFISARTAWRNITNTARSRRDRSPAAMWPPAPAMACIRLICGPTTSATTIRPIC